MPAAVTKNQSKSEAVNYLIIPAHWAFNEWNPDDCTILENEYGTFFVYDHNLQITIAISRNYPALTRWLAKA
jgi:hypothetical protein